MAKNSIRDFDNTAGNNTDIQSVDIAENCAPSGINNAIRELMADMADVNDGTVALVSPEMDSADINGGTIDGTIIGGTTPAAGTFTTLTASGDVNFDSNTLFVDASADAVGIGTSNPSTARLQVKGSGSTVSTNAIFAENSSGAGTFAIRDNGDAFILGNTGIGTSSPNSYTGFTTLTLNNATNGAEIDFEKNGTVQGSIFTPASADDLTITAAHASGDLVFQSGGYTERMRIGSTSIKTKIPVEIQSTSYFIGNATNGYRFNNAANTANLLVIKDSGNVGIGQNVPASKLHIKSGSNSSSPIVSIEGATNNLFELGYDAGAFLNSAAGDSMLFQVSDDTKMTLDTSGNLLVGTTDTNPSNNGASGDAGVAVGNSGYISAARSSESVGLFNRMDSDGDILLLRKDGTDVGSIGVSGNGIYFGDEGDTGFVMDSNSDAIIPFNPSTRAVRGNAIDLGSNGGRFQDLHLNGSAYFGFYSRIGEDLIDQDSLTLICDHTESIIFGQNNAGTLSETARIDEHGNLLVGGTGAVLSSKLLIEGNTGTNNLLVINDTRSTGGTSAVFSINGSQKGLILTTPSGVSYNTSSDYRLKENVTDITDGIERVKQLTPSRFNFIADPDTTVDGFLAHQVSDIVPEAVSGEKDAMQDEEYEVTPAVLDDDGNVVTEAVMGTRSVPDYQGIDQAKLVPLLTAALQEAIAKIETLEAKVTALENSQETL